MSLFRPKQILDIFTDLDLSYYRERGFDTVLLDVDNTIAVPNTGSCDERARKFIEDLKTAGFKVVIFSNNNKKRVQMFLGDLQADYWYYALKPLPFSYLAVCKKMGTVPSKTLVLGDQLLTDILGANLSGCYGIYCRQLQEKDSKMTAFNRRIEKFIWRKVLHEEM
ncbi:MAG: YqeG family HAD IIIA-type phosphatase [Erysipelotrichaceae bacterium]|nr:YqeG family HAD IIIA-type phosphatase [Erysipelotrichaceae bacterium]